MRPSPLPNTWRNRDSLRAHDECQSRSVASHPHPLSEPLGFFNTADGDDPRHYTSARDLAVLALYAMSYPLFRRIVATRHYYIAANRYHHAYDLASVDYVIFWYPGADGVKPGWTSGAGICQVVDVRRGGRHLIGVLLHTPNLYTDVRDLLNYGLGDFTWTPSPWPDVDTPDQSSPPRTAMAR